MIRVVPNKTAQRGLQFFVYSVFSLTFLHIIGEGDSRAGRGGGSGPLDD